LTRKPQIDIRILIYRTWPIGCGFEVFSRVLNFIVIGSVPNKPFGIKSKCSRFSEFHSHKKSDCINLKSTVQIPESSHFQILWRGDNFRSAIIYGTIWGSFPVLGSFAVQFGDHFRVVIICGAVQTSASVIFAKSRLSAARSRYSEMCSIRFFS